MLAGDCRADSPGHHAKFGSCMYTVIDLKTNRVVAFKLVQVNFVMYLIHLFIISTFSMKSPVVVIWRKKDRFVF